MPRSRTALLTAATLCLTAAATADAAPSRYLTTAKPLTAAQEHNGASGQHALAVAHDGSAAVLWGAGTKMRIAQRVPTAGFAPAADLADGGPSALPHVATAPDGTTIAVWRHSVAGIEQVLASVRQPGGAFGAPVQVSNEVVDFPSTQPDVAISAAGRATVVWRGGAGLDDASRFIRVRDVSAAGVPLGMPETISPGNATFPSVAVDAAGNAIVGSTVGGVPRVRYRRADGSQEGDLILGGNATPQAAFAPDGRAFVAYRDTDLKVRTRAPGDDQVLVDEENLTPGPGIPYNADLQLATDELGRVTVAWLELRGGGRAVEAATRPAGAGQDFAPSQVIAEPASDVGETISLAVSPASTALLAWIKGDRLHAVARPAHGAPFGTDSGPRSPDGRQAMTPLAAMDTFGRGMVSFATRPGMAGNWRIEVLPFDDVPRLEPVAVPATATAGTAAAFSATPVDPWSPIASVAWSFGDGTGAGGATAEHAYAAPGARVVSVTATDADGNTTTVERGIDVVAAPADPAAPLVAAADRTRPSLSRVSLSRTRVRRGRRTTARFTLSERATVRLDVLRVLPGRRRTVRVRTLRRSVAAGRRSIALSTRALRAGRYRVVLQATDAAGNRSAKATRALRVRR